MKRLVLWSALFTLATLAVSMRRRVSANVPPSAKAAAPVDLTGYWVSVVTEDWRWRMVTPLKGDAASIPINAEARKIVDAWDPAKDEAAGLQCKAYGAPGLMRIPGRLHITWQDDNTLKIETDAGTQTRLFHFGRQRTRERGRVLAGILSRPLADGTRRARWTGTGAPGWSLAQLGSGDH